MYTLSKKKIVWRVTNLFSRNCLFEVETRPRKKLKTENYNNFSRSLVTMHNSFTGLQDEPLLHLLLIVFTENQAICSFLHALGWTLRHQNFLSNSETDFAGFFAQFLRSTNSTTSMHLMTLELHQVNLLWK